MASLKTQFQAKVLVSSIVFGVIALIAGSINAYQTSTSYSIHEIHEFVLAVKNSVSIAAYADNKELASETVEILSQNSLICYAHLSTFDNQINQSAGNATCTLGFTQPIFSPFAADKNIANLHVGIRYDEIRSRALHFALMSALMILLVLAFTSISLWYATDAVIVGPLLKLVGKVHNLNPGSSERLPIPDHHGADELGLFVYDVNSLLATVERTLADEVSLRLFIHSLQKQYQSIFEHARTGIALIDHKGRCLLANPAVASMLRLNFTADGPFCLQAHQVSSSFGENEQFSELMRMAISTGHVVTGDVPLNSSIEELTKAPWINVSISTHLPLASGDPIDDCQLLECVLVDISERKRIEEETRFKAEHDNLTGLHNRASGMAAIESCLIEGEGMRHGAVLLIDLDRFKFINDTYGHAAGDIVLVEVSKRLVRTSRTADVVSRLGGDEFLIGLIDIGSPENLDNILNRIISLVTQPIDIGNGVQEHVGASIGVAIVPAAGSDIVDLMHHADIAMYKVKRAGRCGFCIYNGVEYSEPTTNTITGLRIENR